jgi:Protein of unknown function (DUF1571)
MSPRPPGMSPAKNGPAAVRRGLLCLGVAAALTAAAGAGENRTASPATADEAASPAKTGTATEKTPAEKNRSATAALAAAPAQSPTRIAVADKETSTRVAGRPLSSSTPETPIERAIRIVADCQDRYQSVADYTCTFFKRERISGKLIPAHIMAMKVRTKPQSIYLRFEQPAKGREAIYIAGRHGGKVLAHDVGFNKLVAGTLALSPTSSRAMEDCRHPITEAGIGPLLETVSKRWAIELNPNETTVNFAEMLVGEQHCAMIETTHPHKSGSFLFYRVRLYIDKEMGLPIRFEAYDWPKHKGAEPELAEEYTYSNLKLNVGLSDRDFDVANGAYSFGRF